MISDEKLIQLDQEGFIPGPSEDEESFLNRVDSCKQKCEHLEQFLKDNPEIPFKIDDLAKNEEISLFNFSANWVPIFYSNKKLSFWHGGVSWIVQEGPFVLVQLRKKLKEHAKYLKIYDRTELIAHEMAHAGRVAFDEPVFEELIAYQTSKSPFRKVAGALIRSPKEIFIFFATILIALGANIFLMASQRFELFPFLHWLNYLPFAVAGYGICRLIYTNWRFKKCLKVLKKVVGTKEKALATIYRLTDKEISLFSKMTPKEVKRFAEKNKSSSLRWRLLKNFYF